MTSAFLPLNTYPEAVSDEAIRAAVGLAGAMGCHVTAALYSVIIPQVASPLGGFVLDVPSLVRGAEEKSREECQRLAGLLQALGSAERPVSSTTAELVLGAALNEAAGEARIHDLSLVPWAKDSAVAEDMAQALLFGSGRPLLMVPGSAKPMALSHLAIAWDGSRVAARALGDALPYLVEGGRVTVLTVQGEKALEQDDPAATLAAALGRRGLKAEARLISMGKGGIATTLQEAALAEGAQVLAMGGFGHSRLREFILGGATDGVLKDLRLPVLLSH